MSKIIGESIYLKHITLEDAKDIVAFRNSSVVKENFICRKDITLDEEINWIKNKVDKKEVVQFVIYIKDTNEKIGSVYFQNIDENNKKCEYGIFIGDRTHLGKGYGSEAARLACDYAFNNMGMNKIYLRLIASNERAYKSYKKVGFEKEGLAKQDVYVDGEYLDILFMAKFKESL